MDSTQVHILFGFANDPGKIATCATNTIFLASLVRIDFSITEHGTQKN